ncbi:MAG TPA: VTT domain-containing protein, partial [Longimicrobium sp.]|nr:VTT domain-containing protein [Longimicrobium sp.]
MRWAILAVALLALILVPFAVAGERMDAWSVAQLRALADRPVLVVLLVVALLTADVLLPVPSSIVATLAGVTLGFAGGAAAAMAGMVAGCVVAYGVGRWAGAPAAERIVGPGEVRRLNALAQRHGGWSLAIARPVPVLAEASTLLAGAAAMPFGRFLAVTTAANLGISIVYAAVGAFAANVQSFLL